jgi:hypothetical protein
MNPEDIKKQAVNRGRDAIASLRRDFTPRDFNALPPVPGQIPSASEPVRRVSPQNKPLTPTQFAVSALKPITQPIAKTVDEAFIKPRAITAQRIGQVISELKPKAENIKRIEAKYNPLIAKSVPRAALSLLQKGKDPKSVALSVAQIASKDLKDYVSDYVSGTLTALDAPNRAIIRPAWDNIKIKLAQDRNQNVDVAGVLQGSKTLSLPDILQINPNSLEYQAYRFLDFAPELINVSGGGTGKTVSLARKVKLPQEGLFDEVAQDAAQKFARETGEALSKEVVDRAKQIAPTLQNIAGTVETPDETSKYVKELVKRQKQAREAGAPTLFQRLKNVANEVDVKLQDFTTPINQAVNNAIKTGKKIAPSENPIFQIDRVLRSNSIASQYVKDNGLASIIQKADDLDEFNQYLIAKSTQELKKIRPDVKTGRNTEADAKLLADLGPKYDALANQVFEYNNNLLNRVRASGLISKDLYNTLIKNRENYVPLQRIFAEIEDITQNLGTREVASIKKQSVVKRLKGSEREIVNPLESILTNTYQAVSQIERNAAAQQIAKLVDNGIIPGEKLGKGEKFNSNEVISFLENGEKVNVFVGKDIARAAKNLKKENTNFLVGLLSVPTRILQAGATGLNTTFILSNLIRDQLTTAIVAGKPLRNTIFNPINFVKAMFDVYGDSKIYDDFLRAGAGFSSLDLTRDTSKTVKQLRAESGFWKKAGFNVTNPANLLNAVEDFIGRAETVTRLQVFKNARDDFRKQGYSAEDAETLAADLARNVTANFARRGEFGTVLNSVIPFFNATVQGTRTLRNAFAKNPKQTTALFATTVGIPVATTTLWNISDPERKKVYDSIPEFEKERNFIILPPVITYDEKGYPFFIRLPKPPGFSNLADPIRKLLEGSYESAPDAVMNIANNLLAATTGYQIPTDEQSRRQLTSQFTPQILKPFIEASTGVNLFTGQRIIPMGLEKLPPEEQVKETTSFTARQIGKALGVSPLLVENTVRTSTAEVGAQLLNLSDRLFAPAGTPQEQVGGRDPLTGLVEVFYRARGGADVEKIYKDIEKIDQEKGLLNLKVKDAILKNDTETLKQLSPFLTKQQFSALENSVSEKEITKTLNPTDKALFKLSVGQLESLKQARPDLNEKIAEIEGFREQFKERTRFDTSGFRFKSTGLKLPKVKTITAKKPRIRKAPKVKKARIPKIKKRKPIKISGIRVKRRKPRNI